MVSAFVRVFWWFCKWIFVIRISSFSVFHMTLIYELDRMKDGLCLERNSFGQN